jgi:hypothetical protein
MDCRVRPMEGGGSILHCIGNFTSPVGGYIQLYHYRLIGKVDDARRRQIPWEGDGRARDSSSLREVNARKKGTAWAVPSKRLTVVMVTCGSVVKAGPHAALPETCGPSRMDKGHFCPVSRTVLCHHARCGNPRLTLVTAVSPSRWICPSHHGRRADSFDSIAGGSLY